jgi:hypothetical protein
LTEITPPERLAVRLTVTDFLVPWRVRSPVAGTVTVLPSAGRVPRSIGDVSVKVAVGYWVTFMIRPRNWLSRRLSSLVTEARSMEMAAVSTVVPEIVTAPSTLPVRPTASTLCPKRTSLTR